MRLDIPRRRQGDHAAIPLVSVVFIMLIFILLVGTLTARDARRVAVPEAASGEAGQRGISELVIDADGTILADGRAVAVEEISPDLFHAGQREVALRADRQIESARLIEVLRALDAAGLEEVHLVVKRAGA